MAEIARHFFSFLLRSWARETQRFLYEQLFKFVIILNTISIINNKFFFFFFCTTSYNSYQHHRNLQSLISQRTLLFLYDRSWHVLPDKRVFAALVLKRLNKTAWAGSTTSPHGKCERIGPINVADFIRLSWRVSCVTLPHLTRAQVAICAWIHKNPSVYKSAIKQSTNTRETTTVGSRAGHQHLRLQVVRCGSP